MISEIPTEIDLNNYEINVPEISGKIFLGF